MVPLDELHDFPGNPNEGDVGAVGESVDEVGFYQVLFVQKSSNRILAGHTRRDTLRDKGETHAPVVYLDVDDEAATRILVGDNEIPRRTSRADDSALAALLVDLQQQTERGIVGTGWDGSDLDRLLADLSTEIVRSDGGQTAVERFSSFSASEIRQIVLIVDVAAFDRAVRILRRMRDVDSDLESNTAAVLALLDQWDAEHPDDAHTSAP